MKHYRTWQTRLAQSRTGRVCLHLFCLCRDHNLNWHLQGITRELAALAKMGHANLTR